MQKAKSSRKEKITKDIDLHDNVSASINGKMLLIKGPKGEVNREIKQRNISIRIDNKKIILESKSGKKEDKKTIGSLVAHIKNMVKGSSQSHVYTLKICSGHFPMNVSISNNKLVVKNFLGEKVPRVLYLKAGADVKIEGDLIYVASANKEIAGQVSADIEQLTRRPGYDTRIFQDGCYIISKDGKELK
ncbi:MAG: 50S ribosomal protein L6 [Nanoarchaeota archaeon]